jgi:outer membrane protein OmpA-like peptidoglycan-associated protein
MRALAPLAVLALALLPLGCARPAAPPHTAAVAPAPVPPPPVSPEPVPGPDPAAAPAPEPEPPTFATRAELPDVHFASGEVRVERAELAALDAVAVWLAANPTQLVMVEGHTDTAGPRAANLSLAQRRARWVMDYLIARGVAPERITAVARGEQETLCADASAACQRRNRRVQFLVRESGPLQVSATPTP